MKNILRYISVILIWGSTWLAIKLQLGVVDPMVTIIYRMAAGSILLFLTCFVTRRSLKFPIKLHLLMALQGITNFAVNYWLFYKAQQVITSGLASIIFSLLVFMNLFNAAIFLKAPVKKTVFLGAISGLIGMILLFQPEFARIEMSSRFLLMIGFSFTGTFIFSLGNIISAYIQKKGMPVVQSTTFAMFYGTLFMTMLALVNNKPFLFDTSISYIGGLGYTIIFGSVIAFLCYLTLIGEIGAGRTAYIMLLTPVVAMSLSTLFEGYQWSFLGILGMFLILFGNYIALKKPKNLISK